jgi:endo-1,4-beta-xylanase
VRTKLLKTFVLVVGFGMVGCDGTDGVRPLRPGEIGGATGVQPNGGSGSVKDTGSGGASATTGSSATGASSTGNGGTSNTGASTGGTNAIGGTGSGDSSSSESGGTKATGGAATGGKATNGGAATGGAVTGGGVGKGGAATGGAATGGAATGGKAAGGAAAGGKSAAGGAATGGAATGGKAAGGAATGGAAPATAGATSTDPVGELDCSNIPPMPTGGTVHSGNGQGGKDNLAWQIWSNGGSGSLTTFSTPAFIATWNNSGDYLGRIGFEWGNAGKAYTAYGTITADLAFKKNGTAGQYSYVGIYGWSTNPCIEWYIVDDSYSAMPFNTGNPVSGTVDLDGGTYNLVTRNTTGTGGNRCGNVTSWNQFYSIRKSGRQCGTISVTKHFDAWAAKGWTLGNLLEVKILVEAASGQGSVDFSVANVKTTQ